MITVIIPTYNEAEEIQDTIKHLQNELDRLLLDEIVIADGGSTDNTLKLAKESGATAVTCPAKGRAKQMNYAASIARSPILYFLHADSIPPKGFTADILNAVRSGKQCGCYRLSFDYDHWFLKLNCWFTRFNLKALRFGDQSLFVTKEVFQKAGGFDERLIVMEDQEIISRLTRFSRFTVLERSVTTSTRKYLENGIYKMQGIFFLIYFMYYLKFPQDKLVRTYKRLIKQNKV